MSDLHVTEHANMANANFPMDAEGRTYHVGCRRGEIANRLLLVGSTGRAQAIASCFDEGKAHFVHVSDRGFHTHTGRVNGVPVTVMAIGMYEKFI